MADNTGKACRDRPLRGGGGERKLPAERELRVHTIAVVNQKGGCGKTTTAINLSGVFASRGYRTLLVDLDPQAHCAAGLAIPEQRIDKHIGDAMLAPENAPIDADRLLWRVSRNLDLAPSTVQLAALEAARGSLAQKADAERRLKSALARFKGQYDICLIDCSPAIGMLTFNALVAADEILIPVETAFFSLHGATKQVNTIKSVAKRLGVQPTYRLLPTMHDPESALARDLLEELRRRFPGRVAPVVIRLDSSLREAASFGQPVVEYSPESPGAVDYGELATFLVEQSLGKGDGRSGLNAPASTTGMESISPRSSQPMPEVHVVPGIADRASSRIVRDEALVAAAATPHEESRSGGGGGAAVVPQTRTTAQPATTASQPAAMVDPPKIFTPTRAADLVARAKKLHSRSADVAFGSETPAAPQIEEPRRSRTEEVERAATPPRPEAPARGDDGVWFGLRVTDRGVVFRQPLTLGRNVRIAGEFNNWSDVATPLRPHATLGVLEGVARVAPGSYQYRLVVDTQWIADPYNPLVAPNPFGGANSIVYVPESAHAMSAADGVAAARPTGGLS